MRASTHRPAVALGRIVVMLGVMALVVGAWLVATVSVAQGGPEGMARPLQPTLTTDVGEGYVPPPLQAEREEWVESDSAAPAPLVEGDALPSTYDLRLLDRLPGVRNQNPYGTCWSFAATASLESGLLPGLRSDFSEDNMVLRSGFGFSDPYDHGGNDLMATAYLARWAGPVDEADDAYGDGSSPSSPVVQRHVQDVVWAPAADGADNEGLKQAVATYGAVSASFYWSSSYYQSSTASFYMPEGVSSRANHAVAVVGWDDGYDRSRFRHTPPGDGAWIVRNSWGSGWGSQGYFYVSYYDPLIGEDCFAYCGAESVDNYDRVYQYDTLGLVNSYGFSSQTGWFACRHTAAADEELAAVSFYALAPGATYEVWAGTGLDVPATSQMQRLADGELDEAGYRTVELPTPFALSAGESFVVAVKVTAPGDTYPIPIEMRWWGYSDESQGAPGQSFVSAEGIEWSDFDTRGLEGDVCLKLFTSVVTSEPEDPEDTEESTPPVTSVSGSGSSWRRSAASLDFSAVDDGTGVARTEYRVDGGPWETVAQGDGAVRLDSTVRVAAPTDHSNDGSHLVEYRSLDVAGNIEPTKTRQVRIDTRRPRTRVTRRMRVRRGRRAVVRFRISDARPGSPRARVTIVVRRRVVRRVGGRIVRRWATSRRITLKKARRVNRTLRYRLRCNLPRGRYKVYVRARDTAGNSARSVRAARLIIR